MKWLICYAYYGNIQRRKEPPVFFNAVITEHPAVWLVDNNAPRQHGVRNCHVLISALEISDTAPGVAEDCDVVLTDILNHGY